MVSSAYLRIYLKSQGAGKWENDEVKTFFKVLSGETERMRKEARGKKYFIGFNFLRLKRKIEIV